MQITIIYKTGGKATSVVFSQTLSRLSCAYKKENQTKMVVCDLGNPMKGGTKVSERISCCIQSDLGADVTCLWAAGGVLSRSCQIIKDTRCFAARRTNVSVSEEH